MRHELKTHPGPFAAVWDCLKKCEIRKTNDRTFCAGDQLLLREYIPEQDAFTGRRALVGVTHVVMGGEWGIPPDLCVMSIEMRVCLHPGMADPPEPT